MRKILAVTLIFISCSGNEKNVALKKERKDTAAEKVQEPSQSEREDRITDTLLKLSFIKKSNAYIDSFSDHRHGIAFLMDSSAEDGKIFVRAGFNGDERFETYYQLYIDPLTMEILVYDPVDDKKLSVKEFEKTNK